MAWEDPIVEEVRKVREALAKEDGYDIKKMCKRLKELEKAHKGRIVTKSDLEKKKRA